MDKIDLQGKICPMPVVEIINRADHLFAGETIIFLVDDPLAIKSVPEELEDYDNIELVITKNKKYWEIKIIDIRSTDEKE